MPVLSTQAWRLSQQRLTEEEQIQLHKELETLKCYNKVVTEVANKI